MMTLDEIRQEKEALEKAVTNLCRSFEQRTKLRVANIQYGDMVVQTGSYPSWFMSREVSVQVEL